MKIYAVVAWFNPDAEYVRNLLSYCKHVDGLIIVDDSSKDNSTLLKDIPQAEYLCARSNRGIAKALNVGYELAVTKGADWILTMDQDSKFEPDQIERYLHYARQQATDNRIAVYSPNHQNERRPSSIDECDSVITSGCLVNAQAYKAISGYNEDLFIDQVDHEFCYRLRKAGYRILRLNNVHMSHLVGTPVSKRFLMLKISSSNHSHIRRYYMTRNRLYMRKHYAEFGAPYLKMIVMDLLKIALVENDKVLKYRHMVKGIVDHLKGVYGKLH